MEWFSQNWVWVLFAVGMVAMHMFGHGGHGGPLRGAVREEGFLIGLLGPDLFPLSSCVQRMRRTRQTSLHLERLGPFFVGRVAWQSAPPSP